MEFEIDTLPDGSLRPRFVGGMTGIEAGDESRPLPDLALYALGWTSEQIEAAKRAEER